MPKNYPSHEEIEQVHQQLLEMRLDRWLNHDMFSFQWFLLLIVLIVPWIIWWRFVDEKRIYPILLFGSLLTILVMMMDDIGVELQLWSYPYQLVTILPRLISIDQGIIVIAHMLLYQYFKKWKKFIIANAVMAAIFTLICEPVTVWLGIYKLDNWRYIYSFPIYIIKAVFIKWLVDEVIERKKIAIKQS